MPAPGNRAAPSGAVASLHPQLLMVYNPRFNARTIRVHVEHLRSRGFVWWGRFNGRPERFDTDAARDRWPHVAKLADERAQAKEASLLFVTNFVDLHVFKASQILLGDNPANGVRAAALPYYEGRSVPIWFRVEDARALSYDQSMTIEWFEQRLGAVRSGAKRPSGEPYARPYDQYSAVLYDFPIVVDAPSAADLFDRAKPPKGKRWANMDDAISSRPVQRARDHLEEQLAPGLWGRLSEETRDLLANGWVERGRLEHDEDVDPAMGYTRIANAVETELCAELMPALERLGGRLKGAGNPAHAAIVERLDAARPRNLDGRGVPWSLGPSLEVLRQLVNRERRVLEKLGLKALVALGTNLKWFEEMKMLRDAASHRGSQRVRPALRRGVVEFFGGDGKVLGAVVDARDEVGSCGVGGRG